MMAIATGTVDLQSVAAYTIAQRKDFAQSLRASFQVSEQQWRPMEQILALTTASRFNIYAYYPHLFMNAFPFVETAVLNDLAWTGRCALDYILLYDCLLDSNKVPDPIILLSSYAFQREYIVRLQRHFPGDSVIWKHLAACENETARALMDEHTRRKYTAGGFDLDAMRRQSVGKAAISRLAIMALACLTDTFDTEVMHSLIASNDHYNFARQIVDDLLDWRKDYEKGHYSFLVTNALDYLGVTAKTALEDYPLQNRVGSVIYTQFADKYLAAAEASLVEAVRLAEQYHTGVDWLNNLADMRTSVSRQCKVLAETKRISKIGKPIQRPQIETNTINLCSSAAEAAQSFLLQRQSPDGCWRDFATSAGESEDWVTGYVGWALLSSGRLPIAARRRAVQWLVQSQFPQGGWGYHRQVVVDADSTAWCVRFLALAAQFDLDSTGKKLKQTVCDGVAVLLAHQHTEGSFSTYVDPAPIRAYLQADESWDLSGWCMPQLCVTAAAIATLRETSTASALEAAVDYVLTQQQSEGFWNSYWWEGPHYATAQMLRALAPLTSARAKTARAAAQAWLRSVQHPDGSWSASTATNRDAVGLPFYTALAVQGLLVDASEESRTAVQRGVQWLVAHQDADGGWQASAKLLLPTTDDQQPWATRDWPVQIRGTGIARRDHRRVFTTATVLKALNRALCSQ